MLKSRDHKIARLAAVSLSTILEFKSFLSDERVFVKEDWIGEKFWMLAKNKKDIWRAKYIKGMANCHLRWAQRYRQWRSSIIEAKTAELQSSWASVIESSGYKQDRGKEAFLATLLYILDPKNKFTRLIKRRSLFRLYEMTSELEVVNFEDKNLNLPFR